MRPRLYNIAHTSAVSDALADKGRSREHDDPRDECRSPTTRIGDDLLAIPWSPWKTAAEVVGEIKEGAVTAFGHWDLDGNGPNLIPTKALARLGIKRVFNGHVHQPRCLDATGSRSSMSAPSKHLAMARARSCT
jgi:hypothetical protein